MSSNLTLNMPVCARAVTESVPIDLCYCTLTRLPCNPHAATENERCFCVKGKLPPSVSSPVNLWNIRSHLHQCWQSCRDDWPMPGSKLIHVSKMEPWWRIYGSTNRITIDSYNVLPPVQRHADTWISADVLWIKSLKTNASGIWIKI